MARDWTGFAQATYSHVGKRVTNANQGVELAAYDLVGLRWGARINKLEFALFVNNLTDKRAELGRETRGIDRLLYVPPRTIGFAFKGAF
jgi:outer membrane receptor protein involved in Fe transport